MPAPHFLQYCPEALSLAILEAALVAVELALREEHPTLDDAPFNQQDLVPPSLLTAHLIVSRAIELRELLSLHSAAVLRSIEFEFDSGPDDGIF